VRNVDVKVSRRLAGVLSDRGRASASILVTRRTAALSKWHRSCS